MTRLQNQETCLRCHFRRTESDALRRHGPSRQVDLNPRWLIPANVHMSHPSGYCQTTLSAEATDDPSAPGGARHTGPSVTDRHRFRQSDKRAVTLGSKSHRPKRGKIEAARQAHCANSLRAGQVDPIRAPTRFVAFCLYSAHRLRPNMPMPRRCHRIFTPRPQRVLWPLQRQWVQTPRRFVAKFSP